MHNSRAGTQSKLAKVSDYQATGWILLKNFQAQPSQHAAAAPASSWY